MKTRISLLFALAAMLCAPTAYGQYIQQPNQPVAPVISPQQSWANSAYRNSIQQPPANNAAYGNPAYGNPANAAYGNNAAGTIGSAAGCDSYGGAGCGTGCDAGAGGNGCCGGMPGCRGGGCGQGGCGAGCGFGGGGFGGAGGCGKYDPCCPTKYISLYGGATYFSDLDTNIGFAVPGGPADTASVDVAFRDGWAVGGAVGRSFGRHLRGEFDFTWRNASVDTVGLTIGGQNQGNLPLDGKMNVYSFMPNLFFDLNPNGKFNAYVGVGAGVAFSELDVDEPNTPVLTNFKGSDFAYQGIAGLSFCIGPRADLFFEYRYFATDRTSLDLASPILSASADVDQSSNNYFVGLRVKRW